MTDHDLRDAFRALRETTSGESPEAADTLERVLASSVKTKRRRLRLLKLWVPLAAALVGSSAYAAASGKLPLWSRGDDAPPPPAPTAVAAATSAPKGPALPATSTMTVPSSSQEAQEDEPPPIAEEPSTLAAKPRPIAESPKTVAEAPPAPQPRPASPATASPATSARSVLAEDKADYEAAYRVHGSAKPNDPAAAKAAVAAWDSYLSKHPKGRFVPEAKYARAVALARAGNRDEAKEALRSFAEGEEGDYRREDAREILDAMKK
jgi:hypothetical protein